MKHKEAFDIIHNSLKKLGAKKGGRSESIIKNKFLTKIVELQKSSFGNQSYLNVSISINSILIPDLKNHIYLPFISEYSPDITTLRMLFNFDTEISDEIRAKQIKELMEKYVIPCLVKFNGEEDVRKFLVSERPPLNHIPVMVKSYFGIK